MTKDEVRVRFIEKLQKLSNIEKYRSDNSIFKKILNIILTHKPKNIMLYIPLNIEFNSRKLIKIIRKKKIKIFVPFMEKKSFKLVLYRLPLEKKKFKISEPKNSNLDFKKIDLTFIPTILIDIDFRRVGFGMGMYDRFFEKKGKYLNNIFFISRKLFFYNKKISNNFDIQSKNYITHKIIKSN